jgi:hypothetical protein
MMSSPFLVLVVFCHGVRGNYVSGSVDAAVCQAGECAKTASSLVQVKQASNRTSVEEISNRTASPTSVNIILTVPGTPSIGFHCFQAVNTTGLSCDGAMATYGNNAPDGSAIPKIADKTFCIEGFDYDYNNAFYCSYNGPNLFWTTLPFGASSTNKKCLGISTNGLFCNSDAITNSYRDQFTASVENNQVCLQRTDQQTGWGDQSLSVTCIYTTMGIVPLVVQIGSSSSGPKCVSVDTTLKLLSCPPTLSNTYSDTFTVEVKTGQVCVTRTFNSVPSTSGWGADMTMTCTYAV